MNFVSVQFFVFLVLAVCLYFAVPRRFQNLVLLAACWIFYSCAGFGNFLLLIVLSVFTYGAAHLLAKRRSAGKGRLLLAAALAVLFGNLCFFKYYRAAAGLIRQLLYPENTALIFEQSGFIMPLGVSFYTFLLAGYLIDIYRCRQIPERSFVRFSVFVSFFPTIASGPIERGKSFLPQLEKPHDFEYERFCSGASRMLWGFFKKFVAAETIGISADRVFGNLQEYAGPYLLFAALLYSYQLYCDFSGYSDIAIGMAQLMGFTVRENFMRPFAARSFGDLWRRWHISLTSWFREYLYFPLGGSRCGSFRTCLNIIIVFLVSGIWHGSTVNFALWGLANGVILVLSRISGKLRADIAGKNPLYQNRFLRAALPTALVYLLFTLCIVFFRAGTPADAAYWFSHLLTGWGTLLHPGVILETLKSMNIGRVTLPVIGCSVLLTECLEWRAEKAGMHTGEWMRTLKPVPRITLYYVLLIFLALFGVLGKSSFIYFGF